MLQVNDSRNGYQLFNQLNITIKNWCDSFTRAGLVFAPNFNEISRRLFYALYQELSLKSDEKHLSFCFEKVKQLHERLNQQDLSIAEFVKLLQPYRIEIIYSKKASVTPPRIDLISLVPSSDPPRVPDLILSNQINPPDQAQVLSLLEQISKDAVVSRVEESIRLITDCISLGTKSTQEVLGKDVVLVIGDTGVGKSTCINYLSGCEMMFEAGGISVSPGSKLPEIMRIGHANSSETLIPEVRTLPTDTTLFCDTPGFYDTRSPDLRIANVVNLRKIFSSAKSVKILVLISADCIVNCRDRWINDTVKILHALFGTDNLDEFSENVLIGVTKAESSAGKPFQLTHLHAKLFKHPLFPKRWIANTYIMDPLIKEKTDDRFGVATWVEYIKALTPLSRPFHTILTADDKCHLMKVSQTITETMMMFITQGKPDEAANGLILLAYLKIIDHDEVETLFKKSLLTIIDYVQEEARFIKNMLDLGNPAAEEKLVALNQIICVFEEKIPTLKGKLKGSIHFALIRKNKQTVALIDSAFEKILNYFYRANIGKQTIALSVLTILSSKAFSLGTIDNYAQTLKTLSALSDIPTLGTFVSDYMGHLDELSQSQSSEQIDLLMRDAFDGIRRLQDSAKCYVYDQVKVETQRITLDINDSLDSISEALQSHKSRKHALSILNQLSPHDELSQLCGLLKELAKIDGLMTQALFIRNAMLSVSSFSRYIPERPPLYSLIQRVVTHLLRMRHRLEGELYEEQVKQLSGLEQRERLQIRNDEQQDFAGVKAARKQLILAQLEQIKQRKAEEKIRIDALSEKAALIAQKKAILDQKKWDDAQKKAASLFSHAANALRIRILREALEKEKQQQLERARLNRERREAIEQKKAERQRMLEKSREALEKLRALQSQKELIRKENEAKKALLQQAKAKILERQREAQAAKQAELARRKEHNEARRKARSIPSASDTEERKNLLTQITTAKADLRTLNLGRVVNHDSPAFRVAALTEALYALETRILRQMSERSLSKELIKKQENRVNQALQAHHTLQRSARSFLNKVNRGLPHATNTHASVDDDLLNHVVLEEDASPNEPSEEPVREDMDVGIDVDGHDSQIEEQSILEQDAQYEALDNAVQSEEDYFREIVDDEQSQVTELQEAEQGIDQLAQEVDHDESQLNTFEENHEAMDNQIAEEEAKIESIEREMHEVDPSDHLDVEPVGPEAEMNDVHEDLSMEPTVENDLADLHEGQDNQADEQNLESELANLDRDDDHVIHDFPADDDHQSPVISEAHHHVDDDFDQGAVHEQKWSLPDDPEPIEAREEYVLNDRDTHVETLEHGLMDDPVQSPVHDYDERYQTNISYEDPPQVSQPHPVEVTHEEPPEVSEPYHVEVIHHEPPEPVESSHAEMNRDVHREDVQSNYSHMKDDDHAEKIEQSYLPDLPSTYTPPETLPGSSYVSGIPSVFGSNQNFFHPQENERGVFDTSRDFTKGIGSVFSGPTTTEEHRAQATVGAVSYLDKLGDRMNNIMEGVVSGDAEKIEDEFSGIQSDVGDALDVVAKDIDETIDKGAELAEKVEDSLGSAFEAAVDRIFKK